jgi:hypothetical protein
MAAGWSVTPAALRPGWGGGREREGERERKREGQLKKIVTQKQT